MKSWWYFAEAYSLCKVFSDTDEIAKIRNNYGKVLAWTTVLWLNFGILILD